MGPKNIKPLNIRGLKAVETLRKPALPTDVRVLPLSSYSLSLPNIVSPAISLGVVDGIADIADIADSTNLIETVADQYASAVGAVSELPQSNPRHSNPFRVFKDLITESVKQGAARIKKGIDAVSQGARAWALEKAPWLGETGIYAAELSTMLAIGLTTPALAKFILGDLFGNAGSFSLGSLGVFGLIPGFEHLGVDPMRTYMPLWDFHRKGFRITTRGVEIIDWSKIDDVLEVVEKIEAAVKGPAKNQRIQIFVPGENGGLKDPERVKELIDWLPETNGEAPVQFEVIVRGEGQEGGAAGWVIYRYSHDGHRILEFKNDGITENGEPLKQTIYVDETKMGPEWIAERAEKSEARSEVVFVLPHGIDPQVVKDAIDELSEPARGIDRKVVLLDSQGRRIYERETDGSSIISMPSDVARAGEAFFSLPEAAGREETQGISIEFLNSRLLKETSEKGYQRLKFVAEREVTPTDAVTILEGAVEREVEVVVVDEAGKTVFSIITTPEGREIVIGEGTLGRFNAEWERGSDFCRLIRILAQKSIDNRSNLTVLSTNGEIVLKVEYLNKFLEVGINPLNNIKEYSAVEVLKKLTASLSEPLSAVIMEMYSGGGNLDVVTEVRGNDRVIYTPHRRLGVSISGPGTILAERIMVERNARILAGKHGANLGRARQFFRDALENAKNNGNDVIRDRYSGAFWTDVWDIMVEKVGQYEAVNRRHAPSFSEIMDIITNQSGTDLARRDNSLELVRTLVEIHESNWSSVLTQIKDLFGSTGSVSVTGAVVGMVKRVAEPQGASALNEMAAVRVLKSQLVDSEIHVVPTLSEGGNGTTPDLLIVSGNNAVFVEVKQSHTGNPAVEGELNSFNMVDFVDTGLREFNHRSRGEDKRISQQFGGALRQLAHISPLVKSYVVGKNVVRRDVLMNIKGFVSFELQKQIVEGLSTILLKTGLKKNVNVTIKFDNGIHRISIDKGIMDIKLFMNRMTPLSVPMAESSNIGDSPTP